LPAGSGAIAEKYLSSRGLKCLLNSTALRFHPTTAHPDLTARPALVARVVDVDGNPIAVHRTYLAPYGHGKAAANPQRASLGPVKGGVIRLFEIDPALPLVVGEGIETSASAGLLLKGTAWAALSAGNLEKSLRLPSSVQEVIIAEDPDPPGHRASRGAAKRWVRDGHIVKVATPSGSGDFNDVLRAKAEATHG
jgi:putative DNA primase/helicase